MKELREEFFRISPLIIKPTKTELDKITQELLIEDLNNLANRIYEAILINYNKPDYSVKSDYSPSFYAYKSTYMQIKRFINTRSKLDLANVRWPNEY